MRSAWHHIPVAPAQVPGVEQPRHGAEHGEACEHSSQPSWPELCGRLQKMERQDEVKRERAEEAQAGSSCHCKRNREAAAINFAKWFVTDFMWPNDGERGLATERNKASLRAMGVAVSEDSVDAMNVGSFLRSQGVDADQVALAVLNGMCSRVGADNNEYRQTQGELRVPAGDGPLSCVFGALAAALPQATVVVSATGAGKENVVANVRVRQTMTRPVLCMNVAYPEPVKGVSYKPESNDSRYRLLPDPVPLALVAVGPAIGVDAPCFGRGARTMHMGALVTQTVSSGGALIFLGEFTCTNALHLAHYAEQVQHHIVQREPSGSKLPKERMEWGGAHYDYDQTVAHCAEKLLGEGRSDRHVGMHAAQLWLYRARGVHVTNFTPGAEWYPAPLGSVAVRGSDRCVAM